MDSRQSITGQSRRRKTSRFVRIGEVLARFFITIGGLGTIIAVVLVCVFLAWVVYPLFLPASVKEIGKIPLPEPSGLPLRTAVDEYQILGWSLFRDGTLQVFRIDNGKILERRPLFPGQVLTACSSPSREEDIAFGFKDGTVRLGRIGFTGRFLDGEELSANQRDFPQGGFAEFEGGLVSRTPEGQFRSQKIKVDLDEPIKATDPASVLLIDLSVRPTGPVVSFLNANGKLRTNAVNTRDDLTTGEKVRELTGGEIDLPGRTDNMSPNHLLLSGVGDNVYLIWNDGHLVRVSTQDLESPKVMEDVDLLDNTSLSLTALQFQIGKTTMLVGDSSGRIRAWFPVKPAHAANADGVVLAAAHDFPGSGVPVTALATSARTRTMAAGYADGRVRLYYVTSEKYLGEEWTQRDQPVQELALAPKDDGLLALTPAGAWRWKLDTRYPEVTFGALFRATWYEGYEKPAHVWQSSSGSDEFEPKFGMWPLIFGTLKATFYSLLLGVPLALMAAVYTSEFLHSRTRRIIKPTIELMASLPSVVLGFLSALVLAPFVENWLSAVLAAFVSVPAALLLGAYLWQTLPPRIALPLSSLRFLFIVLVLPVGIALAVVVGPWIERFLVQGDLKAWLAGHSGTSTIAWTFLFLPLWALATAYLLAQVVNPWLRVFASQWSRATSAVVDLGKFLAAATLCLGAASVTGLTLNAIGFDPRGSMIGTYVQRNALVVGFMMGFAIIPIIYTIAEDALSAVPEHLRSASLGCGATLWQTARRIIIPTAMSGLFSAVMIGLGRAVGETMIVLMAAGNTPIMDMNIFNGFRTLSANIAVELPEAVRDSTHYRTLFLAALTLFAMTFIVNTLAEIIRLRFRRRAYQL